MPSHDLDAFDHAILALVQADNQLTHAAIGARVNLSASAVRRRLAVMRRSGVIVADVSVVDPARLGLSFIVQVAFEREEPASLKAFIARMQAAPAVSACWSVSGEVDFVLVVHAVSPEAFEAWGRAVLMVDPAVRRYATQLVWSRPVFRMAVTPAA